MIGIKSEDNITKREFRKHGWTGNIYFYKQSDADENPRVMHLFNMRDIQSKISPEQGPHKPLVRNFTEANLN